MGIFTQDRVSRRLMVSKRFKRSAKPLSEIGRYAE